MDETGHYMFLVLVHANPESAAENADILPRRNLEADSLFYETPWREDLLGHGIEYLGPGGMEVATDGRILIVKFRALTTVRGLFAYRALLHNDPLLLYKDGSSDGASP